MTADELESILRRWGHVFGEPRPSEWQEPSSGDMGAMTEKLRQRLHIGAGIVRSAPATLREGDRGKVRCKETRGGERPWCPPPELLAVEHAVQDLYYVDSLRSVIIRAEYCLRGMRQREKAIRVGQYEGINLRLPLRRYRYELDFARQWISGRLYGKSRAA